MSKLRSGRAFAVVLFFFVSWVSVVPARAETFFGTVPTGLLELDAYRYPVSLFVPQAYKADRDYPLIVTIPEVGQDPAEHIQYWKGWARRRSMLVVSPTNLFPEDVPYDTDKWILGIIDDTVKRYRVDKSKIFITGEGTGAHYAAYLATNYPEHFSAAVLLNGAWNGQFEQLLLPNKRPVKQVPFLVVAEAGDDAKIKEIERKALEFEGKGYMVRLMKVKDDEELNSDAFKEQVLGWMQESAETWRGVMDKSRRSWKERIYYWFEGLFRVR